MAASSTRTDSHEGTYTVFARFRRGRVVLRRDFPSIEEAIEFAQRSRAIRFHGHDDVFVVEDASGRVVEERARAAVSPDTPAPSVETSARDAPDLAAVRHALVDACAAHGHHLVLMREGMQRLRGAQRKLAVGVETFARVTQEITETSRRAVALGKGPILADEDSTLEGSVAPSSAPRLRTQSEEPPPSQA